VRVARCGLQVIGEEAGRVAARPLRRKKFLKFLFIIFHSLQSRK
jgi:hypothetical protein